MPKDYSHIASIDGRPVLSMYSALAEPRRYKDPKTQRESGDPKYQVKLAIPKDHPKLAQLRAIELAQLRKVFPTATSMDGYTSRFDDGDEMVAHDDKFSWAVGCMVLEATSYADNPPNMSVRIDGATKDLRGGDTRQNVSQEELVRLQGQYFFWGALVLAQVSFRGYEPNKGSPNGGVSCYLNHILSTGRGNRIGGGTDSRFNYSYEGEISDFDPYAPS